MIHDLKQQIEAKIASESTIFSFLCGKLPDLPRFITNISSPHTTSDTSTHMSTLERCSLAIPDPSDLSHLHGDPEDTLLSTCSICFQALSWDMNAAEAEEPIQLACGHIFGASCIQIWSKLNATCPICRAEFEPDFQDTDAARSWENEFETESPLTGYASEYFEMHGDFATFATTADQREEDMWLALVHEEFNPPCASRKRRFSVYEEDIRDSRKRHKHVDWVASDTCHSYSMDSGDASFDELINSHEEWMTCTSSLEEPDDEFSVSYYDVLACR